MQPLSLPNTVYILLILQYTIVQKLANVNNFLQIFYKKSSVFLNDFRNTLFFSEILCFSHLSSFFIITKKFTTEKPFTVSRLKFV